MFRYLVLLSQNPLNVNVYMDAFIFQSLLDVFYTAVLLYPREWFPRPQGLPRVEGRTVVCVLCFLIRTHEFNLQVGQGKQ